MSNTLDGAKVRAANLINKDPNREPVKFTPRAKKIGALLAAAVVLHGPIITAVETGANLAKDIATTVYNGPPKPGQPSEHSNRENGGVKLDQDPIANGVGMPTQVKQLQQNQAVNGPEAQQ
jgi:hypothetical protein